MPLNRKTALKIVSGYGIPKISQKGSHAQYGLGGHKVTLPGHDELAKGTAKSFLEQVSTIVHVPVKDIISKYKIKL